MGSHLCTGRTSPLEGHITIPLLCPPIPQGTLPHAQEPDYTPQAWQKANQDDFDTATDTLHDSL